MVIVKDEVWDRLIYNSQRKRSEWNGNAGIVDGITPNELDRFLIKVDWLHTQLKIKRPYKILEIGTNYGSWSWLLYNTLEAFELETCDIVEESRDEILWINSYYKKDWVKFHHLSSKEFLIGRSGDLVWMDGNHDEEWVKDEILWIQSGGSKEVWVDDWNWEEVRRGVLNSGMKYKVVEESPNKDVAILRID
jgi:hypothetical protein